MNYIIISTKSWYLIRIYLFHILHKKLDYVICQLSFSLRLNNYKYEILILGNSLNNLKKIITIPKYNIYNFPIIINIYEIVPKIIIKEVLYFPKVIININKSLIFYNFIMFYILIFFDHI